MTKRRLRNAGTRPKAFLGIGETGAILAAAGINVAGQMAAAGLNSAATKKAAQDQAKATIQSATRQAEAIKDQTEKNREYQLESQEFIKEQNAQNRELQKDIQMQLQMLMGQQNVNDRLEASKIRVKAGGKTKKLGYPQSLLRGGNMPFKVTDGGGVIPVGSTPEGFDIYEFYGNDHEHYHKTRGGKYKSGVGVKFADGNVIEGEGNQKSNQGELMVVTPDNAYFISKHNINGINPTELVQQGIHPLQAYNIQEQQKAILGINDDGTKIARLGKKKCLLGGTPTIYDYINQIRPDMSTDTLGDVATGVVANTQKRRLRNGGACRRRADIGTPLWNYNTRSPYTPSNNTVVPTWDGTAVWDYNSGNWVTTQPQNIYNGPSPSTVPTGTIPAGTMIPVSGGTPSGSTSYNSNYASDGNTNTRTRGNFWNNADLWGAGINTLGNIGGAWITSSANRSAARTLANAYNEGADIVAEAYRNLKTIDADSIRREDYAAAHAMPALQAPVSFAAAQIAGVDRQLQRRLRNAGRYSMSGASAQNRMSTAEVDAQDMRNKVYSVDQEQMQKIRQANAERVTEAAMTNAKLDTEANKYYTNAMLELKKYNNDIENLKITKPAEVTAEGRINAAEAISQGRTAGATAWANALSGIGLTASNTLSSMAKRRADLENVLLGASTDSQVNYFARNGSRRQKQWYIDRFTNAINSGKLSTEDEALYRRYINMLKY